MIEEWRPVVGFEGCYEVSSIGNVRSVDRWRRNRYSQRLWPGQPVTQWTQKFGHLAVYLYPPGLRRHRRWSVHRLVLLAFVGPCPDKHECCHKDGDPTNNHVDNLYWGTRSQNQRDAVAHGTHNSHLKARRTHCWQGHEYTPENTALISARDGRTSRRCRTCARINAQRFKKAHAA